MQCCTMKVALGITAAYYDHAMEGRDWIVMYSVRDYYWQLNTNFCIRCGAE